MELVAPSGHGYVTHTRHERQKSTVQIGKCDRDLDCICILAKDTPQIKSITVSVVGMPIIELSSAAFSQLPHYDGYVDVLGGFLQGGSLPVASMHTQFLDVTMHLSAVRDGSTEEGPAVYVKWSETMRADVDGETDMQFWQPTRDRACVKREESIAARLAATRAIWDQCRAAKDVLKPPAVVCGQVCYPNLLRTRHGMGGVFLAWY